jgi:hypothetical protein
MEKTLSILVRLASEPDIGARMSNWLSTVIGFFLITKASNNGNKILIGDKEMNNWRGFNINPESVENDSLWLDRKIHSINNWSASSLTFSEFYNGKIYFDFKYQVDENMENLFENSRLIYDISDESGDISLIDIRTLERIEAVD